MDDDSAAYRAIRTGGARLGSAGDLEFLRLGVCFLNVKAEDGSYNGSAARPKEIPARGVHWASPERATNFNLSLTPLKVQGHHQFR
jgi:hypothetical protein